MLEKVDDLLKQAGSDRKHILSATIHIKEMKHFAEMNKVWDASSRYTKVLKNGVCIA
jgi:enamine deaminase RidA (YjgF/YER057c/UK114 family)